MTNDNEDVTVMFPRGKQTLRSASVAGAVTHRPVWTWGPSNRQGRKGLQVDATRGRTVVEQGALLDLEGSVGKDRVCVTWARKGGGPAGAAADHVVGTFCGRNSSVRPALQRRLCCSLGDARGQDDDEEAAMWCRALWDSTADNEGELELHADDVIRVLQWDVDGWCHGA